MSPGQIFNRLFWGVLAFMAFVVVGIPLLWFCWGFLAHHLGDPCTRREAKHANADPRARAIVEHSPFYRCENNIYYSDGRNLTRRLRDFDPATFKVLGGIFAVDKDRLYVVLIQGGLFKDIELKTFSALDVKTFRTAVAPTPEAGCGAENMHVHFAGCDEQFMYYFLGDGVSREPRYQPMPGDAPAATNNDMSRSSPKFGLLPWDSSE